MKIQIFSTDGLGASFFDIDEALEYAHFHQASELKTWVVTVDGEQFNNDHIRRVSMDKFYEIVFDDAFAFAKLCKALPDILDDVIAGMKRDNDENTVFAELKAISPDIMKSLYLLAFKNYEGFEQF